MIDPINAKELERPFNSYAKLNDQADKSSVNNHVSGPTMLNNHIHTHCWSAFYLIWCTTEPSCIIYATGAETQ